MCVHFRYGFSFSSLEAFPGSWRHLLLYLHRCGPSASRLRVINKGFSPLFATPLAHALPSACPTSLLRLSFTPPRSTGISTCCPSTTPFGLALGPDFPRADEPSSGILGFSVRWILTNVPLLTPAFSLPASPRVLSVTLLRHCNAPLPYPQISIASVYGLAPVYFRRRVIRLVSCYALFKGWLLLSQPPSCLYIPTSFPT